MTGKKWFLAILFFSLNNLCVGQAAKDMGRFKYPQSVAKHQEFSRYGVTYADDHMWFHRLMDDSLKNWITQQQDITKEYFSKIRFKKKIRRSLEYYAGAYQSQLSKCGKYYLEFYRSRNHNGTDIYIKSNVDEYPDPIVLSNNISKSDRISVRETYASKGSEYLAFTFSRNGSERQEIKVVTLPDGTDLSDHLTQYSYSDIKGWGGFGWKGRGFFYVRSSRVGEENSYDLDNYIYYHHLNTTQEDDSLVFRAKWLEDKSVNLKVTTDERYLIIYEHRHKAGLTNVYIDDFEDDIKGFQLVLRDFEGEIEVLENVNDQLFLKTDVTSDRNWVAAIDLSGDMEFKQVIGPDSLDGVLVNAKMVGKRIVCVFQKKENQEIQVFDYHGKSLFRNSVGIGKSVGRIEGTTSDHEFVISVNSFIGHPTYGVFDLDKNSLVNKVNSVHRRFDSKDYLIQRVHVPSIDSLEIPVTIIRHKNKFNSNGDNVTLLSTYGGYGLIAGTYFNPSVITILENGGVYAYAHIRGEGDKGTAWHRQGKGLNKGKGVNDLISVAEYLIKMKYCNADKLALTGASHGGFVVGAAVAKRPDLFRVAMPLVGVFDLIHPRSVQAEFGALFDSTAFVNRVRLSPYHNLKDTINPAVLILASLTDGRVSPFNSFKFVSKFQDMNNNTRPALLWAKGKGHNMVSSFEEYLNLQADILSFMYFSMDERPNLIGPGSGNN